VIHTAIVPLQRAAEKRADFFGGTKGEWIWIHGVVVCGVPTFLWPKMAAKIEITFNHYYSLFMFGMFTSWGVEVVSNLTGTAGPKSIANDFNCSCGSRVL